MAGISKAERDRRASEKDDAKHSSEFGGTAYAGLQEQVDATNAIDERAEDRRPATLVNVETQEAAPDNRQFSSDEGKALNQMVGRAAITENHDPFPHLTAAENAPPTVHPAGEYQGEGDQIRLLRGYQADEGMKRLAGEVIRVPSKEAKRLVNLGAAKFIED